MYGAPDMPRVPWKAQAPSLLQLLYAGEGGKPRCKCESRKAKAHRFPQPVTTNTSFLNLEACACLFSSHSA